MEKNVKIYGANWCPDCRRVKDFLKKNNIEFEDFNLDINPESAIIVENINNGKRIIPTLLIDEKPYSNPQNNILSEILGLNPNGRITLYGADWCPDCRRAKRYLQDNKMNFQFIDVEKVKGATEYVISQNNGKRIIPTIVIDNKVFANPSNDILNKELKIYQKQETRIYDVIIIGAGAAGLTTSIYSQRDRFDTLILEKKNIGGNAFLTGKIENYPGFASVTGPELMDKMAEQAIMYGAQIETGVEVKDIVKKDNAFEVLTNMGIKLGKSIVLATGSTYRRLNIPGENELIGSGIHFCATCDGAFYRDKEIIVIGGGNSALEEGIFLAGFCKKVSIIHRSEKFSATETYIEKIAEIPNIKVHLNKNPVSFLSHVNKTFRGVIVSNNTLGTTEEINADGAFIFIGTIPNTEFLKSIVNTNESGFILTKGLNETNVKGIFAAGDCRNGAIAQVAAATGEGVVASYGVREVLKK